MYASYLIANQCKCVVLLGPNYKIIFRVLSRILDHITEFVDACFEAGFDRIREVGYACFEALSVFKDFVEEGIDWSRRKESVLTNCSKARLRYRLIAILINLFSTLPLNML